MTLENPAVGERHATAAQVIATLVDKTFNRLNFLVVSVFAPGVVLLVAALIAAPPFMVVPGLSLALSGLVAWFHLKRQRAALHQLIAHPDRVAQIVPIVQTVGSAGLGVTNYPIVLVSDDGRAFRVGTWARSVETAVAPFRAHFTAARPFEGADSGFAPDQGFAARARPIGLMMGSLLLSGGVTLLVETPKVTRHLAHLDELEQQRARRAKAQATAVSELVGVTTDKPWTECRFGVDGVPVRLDDARPGRHPRREGTLYSGLRLELRDDQTPVWPSDSRWFEAMSNALMGHLGPPMPLPRQSFIVGRRTDDTLTLRLIDSDSGEVQCEGFANVAPTAEGARREEDEALAAAVMRPFCSKLGLGTCAALGSEPVSAIEPVKAPRTKATKKGATNVRTEASALDRAAILAVLRGAEPRARGCYEQGLRNDRTLAGTLTTAIVIGADGKVTKASASGLSDATVTACVTKVFQTLRFPRPVDGKSVAVKYPLAFALAR